MDLYFSAQFLRISSFKSVYYNYCLQVVMSTANPHTTDGSAAGVTTSVLNIQIEECPASVPTSGAARKKRSPTIQEDSLQVDIVVPHDLGMLVR